MWNNHTCISLYNNSVARTHTHTCTNTYISLYSTYVYYTHTHMYYNNVHITCRYGYRLYILQDIK